MRTIPTRYGNASDYMTGSAKAAVDTALRDAKAQRVNGTVPTPASPPPTDAARPTPAAEAARGTS